MSLPIPDLRFEQSFLRSLDGYAGKRSDGGLSEKELQALESGDPDALAPAPLNPVTPGIVVYAVLKDQIIMPLVQGFIWAGILLSWRPVRVGIIRYGQRSGEYLFNMIGLGKMR
ncbi:hypothetical protein CLIB1423_10S01508 [[Candida] railenensis]|uniref:Uncharacterized protein n=1 Tax=[Candida] railenensis TaxID=45579 RepID=A0A9P0QQY3_9ASCO|nr:hypothetical protein CLIB1423_10S01508 [[Candida] railenensis]